MTLGVGLSLSDDHRLFLWRRSVHVDRDPRVFCIRDLGAARVTVVTARGLCDQYGLWAWPVYIYRDSGVFSLRFLYIHCLCGGFLYVVGVRFLAAIAVCGPWQILIIK